MVKTTFADLYITPAQKAELIARTADNPQVEVCGVITDKGITWLDNLSASPDNEAIALFDPAESGNIAFFHSHPYGPAVCSSEDVRQSILHGIPYVMLSLKPFGWDIFNPHTISEGFEGLPYVYGIYDCYSLVQRYLKTKFAVELPDYPRHYEGEWDEAGWNIFAQEFHKYGQEVPRSQVKDGDVIMFSCLGLGKIDHIGVVTEPPRFLHHPIGRLSDKAIYGRYWENMTATIVRPTALIA